MYRKTSALGALILSVISGTHWRYWHVSHRDIVTISVVFEGQLLGQYDM